MTLRRNAYRKMILEDELRKRFEHLTEKKEPKDIDNPYDYPLEIHYFCKIQTLKGFQKYASCQLIMFLSACFFQLINYIKEKYKTHHLS